MDQNDGHIRIFKLALPKWKYWDILVASVEINKIRKSID